MQYKTNNTENTDSLVRDLNPGSSVEFIVPAQVEIEEGRDDFGLAMKDIGLYLKLEVSSIGRVKRFPNGKVGKLVTCLILGTKSLKNMEVKDGIEGFEGTTESIVGRMSF